MNLIAIETATEACSLAVWTDGGIVERFAIAPRRHADLALPWADALLAEAGIGRRQLDAVAVSRGPGAFTGVRLGIALAQGMALGLDIPLVAVSTLKVLAAGAVAAGESDGQRIVSAIDARMDEVYVAAWQVRSGELSALDGERVIAPDAYLLPQEGGGWHGVGTGFAACDGALRQRLQARCITIDAAALPRAGTLARLAARECARGHAIAPEQVEPAYLRNQVALTLAEQQAARASAQ